MSAAKSTKIESTEPSKAQETMEKKETAPALGALDEDDEFEEFETDGTSGDEMSLRMGTDWPDESTVMGNQANTNGASGPATVALDMSGSSRSGSDHLWEDNWNDDDIEDEFSVALRYV